MFKPRITLEKDLYQKIKIMSEIAGYASVQEFVVHVLEREIAQLDDAATEEEIRDRLRGLGYIS